MVVVSDCNIVQKLTWKHRNERRSNNDDINLVLNNIDLVLNMYQFCQRKRTSVGERFSNVFRLCSFL